MLLEQTWSSSSTDLNRLRTAYFFVSWFTYSCSFLIILAFFFSSALRQTMQVCKPKAASVSVRDTSQLTEQSNFIQHMNRATITWTAGKSHLRVVLFLPHGRSGDVGGRRGSGVVGGVDDDYWQSTPFGGSWDVHPPASTPVRRGRVPHLDGAPGSTLHSRGRNIT